MRIHLHFVSSLNAKLCRPFKGSEMRRRRAVGRGQSESVLVLMGRRLLDALLRVPAAVRAVVRQLEDTVDSNQCHREWIDVISHHMIWTKL